MSSATVRIQPGEVLSAPKLFAPSLPFMPSLGPPLLGLALYRYLASGSACRQIGRSYPRSNHPEVVEMRRYKQAGNSIICKCLHTSVGDMFQTLRARLIAICVAITVFSF